MNKEIIARFFSEAILTRTEMTVVELIAEGWSNETIASKRGRTKKTIERQMNMLYEKLRADFNTDGKSPRCFLTALYYYNKQLVEEK